MAGPLRGERNACPGLKPPRPRNSWILYRRDQLRRLPRGQMTQADVSQLISKMWREAPAHVHAEYERLAEEEKAEHKRMFPDYRYRPMKKEDKERMKEAKKKTKELERQEKNPRRRIQKTVDVSSSSPASQITTLIVDPPHLRYGPAGPTPPLSVASSPSNASSSPVPPSGVNIPTSVSASDFPVAHDPTSMPAANAQLPYLSVPEPSLVMPQPIHHVPRWQLSQNIGVQANYDPWVNPAPAQPSDAPVSSYRLHYYHLLNIIYQENVFFDMPQTTVEHLQAWLQQSNDVQLTESFQTMLSSTGDPSVYQLHNFDSNALTTDPNAELEISVGHIFQSQLNTSFLDTIFSNSSTQPSTAQAAANNCFYNPNEFNVDAFNVDEFLNYDPSAPPLNTSVPDTPSTGVSTESTLETRPSSAPTPYVPPAGAAFSSNRRVGASWKGSYHAMSSPIDHSPPRAIQVPAR